LYRDIVADGIDDRLDRPFVFWLAGKSAIEIDDVQTARALREPVAGLLIR